MQGLMKGWQQAGSGGSAGAAAGGLNPSQLENLSAPHAPAT